MKNSCLAVLGIVVLHAVLLVAANGQATVEFTYQGTLEDNGAPANGIYDFEFLLYSQAEGGSPYFFTQAKPNVTVTDGSFTVLLNFGSEQGFPPDVFRFLEIRMNRDGEPGWTTLTPRQRVGAAPYAITSRTAVNASTADFATSAGSASTADSATNSLQLGGVPASDYVVTTDPRLTDARTPTAGSGNYIQNGTTEQASSNFNISGTGEANIVKARTQFNIGSDRVLRADGTSNTFTGIGTGSANTGSENSFFGRNSGFANSSGTGNSFFGASSGASNANGGGNSFFGRFAGFANTSGESNSFFGILSGSSSTTGNANSFFGSSAGKDIVTGGANTFVGNLAGANRTSGDLLTALGAGAGFSANGLSYATAIGAGAIVATSNTIQLGRANGSDKVKISGNLDVAGTITGTLPAGSVNYVQNSTNLQASSNFNISGTGTANTFNVTSQYNINGERVLSIPNVLTNLAVGRFAGESLLGLLGSNTFIGAEAGRNTTYGISNTFAGANAGLSNTEGSDNVFVGSSAGRNNTTGSYNVFVGYVAGKGSTTGNYNTFVGRYAGQSNSTGNSNVFIGTDTGSANTDGEFNTYVGQGAGLRTTIASDNSFFGRGSGSSTNTGSANTFIGKDAGSINTTGSHNTMVGEDANVLGSPVTYATAIGSGSRVSTNNTIVLGRPQDGVSMPGIASIGNITPAYGELNINAPTTNADLFMSGDGATKGINFGVDSTTAADAKLFISQYDGTIYKDRLWINEFGVVSIGTLGLAGSTSVCRNASLQFATCSSSRRYKDNIENFSSGFDLIKSLRPVSFNWKDGGTLDLGLVAEEVAAVEPLLTTTNTNGQVEGVKYDRVGVVLINVVKEQQEEIESLRDEVKSEKEKGKKRADQFEKRLSAQGDQIEALKALVCASNPGASVCKQ